MSDRPNCLGWHAPDPICDGGGPNNEDVCTWRNRCKRVQALITGRPDAASVAAATAQAEAEGLLSSEATPERPSVAEEAPEPGGEPPAPKKRRTRKQSAAPRVFQPIRSTGGGLVRTANNIFPRPTPQYDHVLPVVDIFAEKVAEALNTRLMQEGDPETRPGDLFIRWTAGMQGRAATLYEATASNTTRHFMLTRIVLLKRKRRFNLKTGIRQDNYWLAIDQRPPTGVECRVWKDTIPSVALIGVDENAAKEAARWLVRCYRAALIYKPVRAKRKK